MPSTPYIVYGIVYNSFNNNIADAQVTFASSAGSMTVVSSTKGKYSFDLANVGYTQGETITYSTYDYYRNEYTTGTFVVSGGGLNLNITLSEITDATPLPSNRALQLHSIGAKPISIANPLPILVTDPSKIKGPKTITYDSNNNPTIVVKTEGSDTYTQIIAYDSNGNPTNVSRWVKS